jgi:hypothetical protein
MGSFEAFCANVTSNRSDRSEASLPKPNIRVGGYNADKKIFQETRLGSQEISNTVSKQVLTRFLEHLLHRRFSKGHRVTKQEWEIETKPLGELKLEVHDLLLDTCCQRSLAIHSYLGEPKAKFGWRQLALTTAIAAGVDDYPLSQALSPIVGSDPFHEGTKFQMQEELWVQTPGAMPREATQNRPPDANKKCTLWHNFSSCSTDSINGDGEIDNDLDLFEDKHLPKMQAPVYQVN